MNDKEFAGIVTKLAASPEKCALLRSVTPSALTKTAGALSTVGGALSKAFGGAEGLQKVVQGVAGAGLGALAIAGGSKVYSALTHNKEELLKAEAIESGKIRAQAAMRDLRKIELEPEHKGVWKKLQTDEILQKADKSMIASAYETMKRFAPSLAADENAARSFLREHAIYGTGPSYASLKNLADAEKSVMGAGSTKG